MIIDWVKRGWIGSTRLRAFDRLFALSPSLLIWPARGAGWQGTSGGTLAAAGQPLGLGVDLAQLGGRTLSEWLAAPTTPELVTNGDFSNGTTGWSVSSATLSESGGVLQISAQSTTPVQATQTITTFVAGRVYLVTGTYWQTGSGGVAARMSLFGITTPNNNTSTPLTASMIVVASSTTATISLASFGTSSTVSHFDNVSVRELPGNHLRAGTWASPSDAARGTFQNDAINFGGVDDYYSLLSPISITENMTVVRAFKRASAGINSHGLGNNSSGILYPDRWRDADNIVYGGLGGSNAAITTASTLTGSFVATVTRNSATEGHRRNGTSIGSRAAATVSGVLDNIGRVNTVYNSGEISFLAVFPTELTGADLALVERIAASTNGATLA